MEARKRGVQSAAAPEDDTDEALERVGADGTEDEVPDEPEEEEEADYDGGEEDKEHEAPARISMSDETDEDDTMVLLAGIAGFLLEMMAGILILRIDVSLDKSYVMAAGMIELAISVLYLSFCSKKKVSRLEEDTISPFFVFCIAGGFGLLLGGLFGDLIRRFPPGTRFIPGLF